MLGKSFDNKKNNLIQVHVFSASRVVGDMDTWNRVNNEIGMYNIIRQNVIGIPDPVPNASANKLINDIFKLVPGVGGIISKKIGSGLGKGAGAMGLGYLAADNIFDIYKRTLKTEGKALFKQNISNFYNLVSSIVKNPKNTRDNIKNIKDVFMKSGQSYVLIMLGPIHYGGVNHKSPKENGFAYTSESIMLSSPPSEILLSQGLVHMMKTKQGILSHFNKGISNLSNAKISSDRRIKSYIKNSLSNLKKKLKPKRKANKNITTKKEIKKPKRSISSIFKRKTKKNNKASENKNYSQSAAAA